MVLAGDTEPFPDDRAGGEQAACRRRRGRGRPRCAEPLARRRCVAPLCTGVARSRTPGASPAGARRVVRPAACITGLRGGAAVAEVGVEPAASGTRRECGDDGPQAAADPVDVDQAGLAVARCRAREQCRARTRDARRGTRAPGWVVLSVAPVPSCVLTACCRSWKTAFAGVRHNVTVHSPAVTECRAQSREHFQGVPQLSFLSLEQVAPVLCFYLRRARYPCRADPVQLSDAWTHCLPVPPPACISCWERRAIFQRPCRPLLRA